MGRGYWVFFMRVAHLLEADGETLFAIVINSLKLLLRKMLTWLKEII